MVYSFHPPTAGSKAHNDLRDFSEITPKLAELRKNRISTVFFFFPEVSVLRCWKKVSEEQLKGFRGWRDEKIMNNPTLQALQYVIQNKNNHKL